MSGTDVGVRLFLNIAGFVVLQSQKHHRDSRSVANHVPNEQNRSEVSVDRLKIGKSYAHKDEPGGKPIKKNIVNRIENHRKNV